MTASVTEVRARTEAATAKARFNGTLDEAKARLAPKTLAGHAVQAAKDKTIVVADDTVTAVKRKPMLAGGIAAGTALLLVRRPLFWAIGKLFGRKDRGIKATKSRRAYVRELEDIDDV